MERTERFYKIQNLLRSRHFVSTQDFMAELGVSRATFKRDLEYLRDRMHAPIVFDRDRGGYTVADAGFGPQYELPGLWFDEREILALLTMHRMLEDLGTGGLLGPQVRPLIDRLEALLVQTLDVWRAANRSAA